MTDLGSSVRLTASPRDAAGNSIDAAGLQATILQPDGTSTSALSPVHDATGTYHLDWTPTQVGRHVVRWLSTDGWASTDAFDVWPADPQFLFSEAEAWTTLGQAPRPQSRRRDQLRLYMAAVTPVIEDLVGPIVPRTVDEWLDGGRGQLVLGTPNVLSVTSVAESWGGGNFQTLAAAALDSGNTGGAYAYTFDPPATITRRSSNSVVAFPGGSRNVHVVYRAGLSVVPPNVKLAALEQFRFLWDHGQAASHGEMAGDSPDVEFTPSGYAVPRYVIQLCGRHPETTFGIA